MMNAAVRLETLIDAAATAYPERMALICGERRWTYRALAMEMDRRAAILVETGLDAGDVVIVNDIVTDAVAITFFACCRAGVALLYLSPKLTATELVSLSTRADARAILTATGAPHPALPALPALVLGLPGDPGDAARGGGGTLRLRHSG